MSDSEVHELVKTERAARYFSDLVPSLPVLLPYLQRRV